MTSPVAPPQPAESTTDALTTFACRGCGGDAARRLFDRPVPRSAGHEPVACERCGLVALDPMPAEDELPEYYDADYRAPDGRRFGAAMEAAVAVFRSARVRWLTGAGLCAGRVLDLGCGRGLFLAELQRRGFEVRGLEVSDHAANAARQRLGQRSVHVGALADQGFADASFQAITAWQVFEHLPEPRQVLAECHRILEPGGLLVLAVPNIASSQARRGGPLWFHLDVPRHLFHYSPDTLGRLLTEAGFELELVSHHNLEQNPFGAIQTFLHRLGRPFCGLYDALRGRAGARWPALAVTAALLPVAVASSLWSGLRRDGATFTVRARRR